MAVSVVSNVTYWPKANMQSCRLQRRLCEQSGRETCKGSFTLI
ncbi:hypothetical protein ABIB95_005680 [Bradyrhizobium sp. LA2.1]